MHLARAFAVRGANVVAAISRPRAAYDEIRARRLATLQAHVRLVETDLRVAGAMSTLIGEVAPDLLVHHAGDAISYGSLDYDLAASMAVNVAPLDEIYGALAGSGCGVIITGSSAEYSASDSANDEDEACRPDTPYGLS